MNLLHHATEAFGSTLVHRLTHTERTSCRALAVGATAFFWLLTRVRADIAFHFERSAPSRIAIRNESEDRPEGEFNRCRISCGGAITSLYPCRGSRPPP